MSLYFIFITIAIDAIGLGIVIPVLPQIMSRFFNDANQSSLYYGYFVAIYAFMQFLSAPLLGLLSDRFGRRPILLLSLFGAFIDYMIMAYAQTLPLLFFGRMISGISGASFTVANAFIADISDDTNRSRNFGLIGAGFGLGFILGPALGGILGSTDSSTPFLAAAILNLLNFFFGFFVLPESLSKQNLKKNKQKKLTLKILNPLHSLQWIFQLKSIQVLLLIHLLTQMASLTHPSIWTLYTTHRFQWDTAHVGLSLSLVGVLSALSQGLLTQKLVEWFSEKKVLLYGCLGEAISFFLFGAATTGTMLYCVLIFSSFFWSMQPALQSIITRQTPPDRQGEVQGTLMGLISLLSILNPILMTKIFALGSSFSLTLNPIRLERTALIGNLAGSPYLLSSLFFFAAFYYTRKWINKPGKLH